ncbi:MAG: sigma-70 family RNA polymerase sigma factor [Clostridiales bacterium]|nr:sigma-70 family RNA polymerase sigma factor [Clostridiales bacterium]
MLEFLLLLFGKLAFFTGLVRGKNAFPPPLSPEEEEEFFRKYREKGDDTARHKLIEHNLRLVAHIVKKYAGSYDTDDLISVGSIGLMKAVSTYQPSKGTSLATFAARCIENEILMLFRANKKYKNEVSLMEPVGTDKDGNELTLMELLTGSEESVFEQVDTRVSARKIMQKMKEVLTEREYKILVLRFGLNGNPPLAQREVAALLKISRSYISRIEKKAVEKLRKIAEE